jgi:signal recognition particle GTPase
MRGRGSLEQNVESLARLIEDGKTQKIKEPSIEELQKELRQKNIALDACKEIV